MKITFRIWRQDGPQDPGRLQDYPLEGVDPGMTFLETLDLLNEQLTRSGADPVAFDHGCRQGHCGACGAVVNGRPHGPAERTTLCQLPMAAFTDGDMIVVEPFRARAFPVIKDLMVDRSALDRLVGTAHSPRDPAGQVQEGPDLPADALTEACIQCGACVAACPNAAAVLFVGAQLGAGAGKTKVVQTVEAMDQLGFGGCANNFACETACPKGIPVTVIADLKRALALAVFRNFPKS